jgi:squalene cyclase
MDITRSVEYIEVHGTILEKARIRYILYNQKPDDKIIQNLVRLQNTDGGFPFNLIEGRLSTINKSSVGLLWLEELGYLDSVYADRVADYLLLMQCDDGGWDEDPAILQYDLPPWITPGDLKTRAYLSSISVYWLLIKGFRGLPPVVKALAYLRDLQDDTGRFFGYLHTNWIATSVFFLAGPNYLVTAEKGLDSLKDSPLPDWEASQIAWALECLGKAGLKAHHPLIDQLVAELIKRRRPDGTWTSEDGASFTCGAVIGVLKALKHFGIF